MNMQKRQNKAWIDRLLTASVLLLFVIYLGIFFFLNMFKYTQHVDSDIAAEALLSREIWLEKDPAPDNWISSTERRILATPTVAALFYGASGSMVLSMGASCCLLGAVLLLSFAFVLKRCRLSIQGILTALLAICALPINGLENEGQLVPFVHLLWFLFADYYTFHCICLFTCIMFYLYLRGLAQSVDPIPYKKCIFPWIFNLGLCGTLALGGMRCLQVVVLPLFVCEVLFLFVESRALTLSLPPKRYLASGFVLSLTLVALLAKLYPSNVNYPLYLEDAEEITDRSLHLVPAAILKCLGIAGNVSLTSFAALLQLVMLGILIAVAGGLFWLRRQLSFSQKTLICILASSFLLTVLVEMLSSAAVMPYYFFCLWFVLTTGIGILVSYTQKNAVPIFRLIILCICTFAICNLFYTYKDCVCTTDNLHDYEEVISYMEAEDLPYGYGNFWDAPRISVMTDGRLTMGNCYHMSDLHMYWWLTSTKWYVPTLPQDMRTAYVVRQSEKEAFEAQFDDPSVVRLGFENQRFAVYVSDHNLVSMN